VVVSQYREGADRRSQNPLPYFSWSWNSNLQLLLSLSVLRTESDLNCVGLLHLPLISKEREKQVNVWKGEYEEKITEILFWISWDVLLFNHHQRFWKMTYNYIAIRLGKRELHSPLCTFPSSTHSKPFISCFRPQISFLFNRGRTLEVGFTM
jgi:hypothetical protein